MGKQSRLDAFRQWVGGLLFRAAGLLHPTYDVWLDDAEPRRPSQCIRDPYHEGPCNGFPRPDCPGYNYKGPAYNA